MSRNIRFWQVFCYSSENLSNTTHKGTPGEQEGARDEAALPGLQIGHTWVLDSWPQNRGKQTPIVYKSSRSRFPLIAA